MSNDTEIHPGRGVGPLVLGMSRDEVREALGAPETEEEHTHEDDTQMVSWEFREGRLETDFSSDDDYRLGSITTADHESQIEGVALIGMRESEFLASAKDAGVGPLKLDAEFADLKARDYIWDKMNMSFWVREGVLESITVMPRYDRSGNVPQWPDR